MARSRIPEAPLTPTLYEPGGLDSARWAALLGAIEGELTTLEDSANLSQGMGHAYVRVNGICCPSHGPVTPEGVSYPFSMDVEAARTVAAEGWFLCAGRGCEGTMLLDAEPAKKRLVQHLALAWAHEFPNDYEHDRYASTAAQWAAMGFDVSKPRPVWLMPPIEKGIYASGVGLAGYGGADQEWREDVAARFPESGSLSLEELSRAV